MMRDAPILSDARLDALGELYQQHPELRRRGVLFDTFVRYPDELLAAIATTGSAEQLAAQRQIAQRQVRDRLDAQTLRTARALNDRSILAVRAAVHRDSGFIEPLKNRIWPKRAHASGRHNPKHLGASR